jgi:hypothetical protein
MQNNNLPSFGLVGIFTTLELIGSHNNGATALARSCLVDGRRTVRVELYQDHLLVSRALLRADTLTIRFLIALSLVEFCAFWSGSRDGSAVRNELKKIAGFTPGDQAWGSAFASRLSIALPMRVVDDLPIFSRDPKTGDSFKLFSFEAAQRVPSDITNWRAKDGHEEVVRPLPPKPRKPALAASIATPDPFLSAFYERAKEVLTIDEFAAITDLARGGANA